LTESKNLSVIIVILVEDVERCYPVAAAEVARPKCAVPGKPGSYAVAQQTPSRHQGGVTQHLPFLMNQKSCPS